MADARTGGAGAASATVAEAARAMRDILVEDARQKATQKRGGELVRIELSPELDVAAPAQQMLTLDFSLGRLEELDPEDEEVTERGQIGWTVIVSRTVRYADGEEKSEKRKVVYSPWVRKVRVHPCKIPEGEDGHTGEPCPEPEEEDEAGAEGEEDGEIEPTPHDPLKQEPEQPPE